MVIVMEPKIGLAPIVIDIVTKTSPTLDELVFGSVVILLINDLILKYLLNKKVPMWKHIVIMVCSDCAFLINNFVKIYARDIYGPTITIYGAVFFSIYYLIMYKTPKAKIFSLEIIPSFMMGMVYTFGVIALEGFWRVGFWVQDFTVLFTNPNVTFFRRDFVFTVIFTILAVISQKVIDKIKSKK